jgi:NAD(P)-dependent dehydrogenase (short-subunit alcohol dehydrogenase family)
VRKMVEAGEGGTVIAITSQMGHVGAANRTVYCATKHALEGLTKALAVELAPLGIRAVSIAPTFIRTDMTAAQLDHPEVGPKLLAEIPQGRFGSVEDVASAVVYAASPAAELMTGTSLVLDGGWTAK